MLGTKQINAWCPVWYNGCIGSVAQWIEQFRPKEKVVRSSRTRVTKFGWELA